MATIKLQNGDLAVQTTIYLPFEMREKAKDLGINLSKTCRSAISDEINRKTSEVQTDE